MNIIINGYSFKAKNNKRSEPASLKFLRSQIFEKYNNDIYFFISIVVNYTFLSKENII